MNKSDNVIIYNIQYIKIINTNIYIALRYSKIYIVETYTH